MFENWQRLVKQNMVLKAEKEKVKNQKSTNLNVTSTDLNIWKAGDGDREQSSGCVFKEDKQ